MNARQVTAPIVHPDWCNAEWCDTDFPSDVEHRSAPATWSTRTGVGIGVGMSRDDEHGQPWRTGLRLDVTFQTDSPHPQEVQGYLTIEEGERLALEILANAARARREAAEAGIGDTAGGAW